MTTPKEAKKVWDDLTAHVHRGEEAEKLLQQVYAEMGPYRQEPVSDETWSKVLKFFKFDDSE